MAGEADSFRLYDPSRDHEAVMRVFAECGWIDSVEACAPMESVLEGADEAWVATIDGQPEVLVMGALGELVYDGQPLRAGVITGVIASVVCRKQGVAGRLTAWVAARLVDAGAIVSALGAFDRGYYDALGFGQGAYDHFVWLDPSRLSVPDLSRRPVRIGLSDVEEIHAARWRRLRFHGSVSLDGIGNTRESLQSPPSGLGLGFRNQEGRLTHYAWFGRVDPESGPWLMKHHAFETWPQYMELLSLVRSLGDQVRMMRLYEPSGMHLQSLIERPFRHLGKTKGSAYPEKVQAMAWSQYRVNDVAATMAAMKSPVPVSFELRLTDPIQERLQRQSGDLGQRPPWRGAQGTYRVQLSPEGGRVDAVSPSSPTPDDGALDDGVLAATVNQWTAWWLGVSPASVLATQGGFEASKDLLRQLDSAVRLPQPRPDWDF